MDEFAQVVPPVAVGIPKALVSPQLELESVVETIAVGVAEFRSGDDLAGLKGGGGRVGRDGEQPESQQEQAKFTHDSTGLARRFGQNNPRRLRSL